MPCYELISDCAQMSKTIIAVRLFGLGGRESLETAVICLYIVLFMTQHVRIYNFVNFSFLRYVH